MSNVILEDKMWNADQITSPRKISSVENVNTIIRIDQNEDNTDAHQHKLLVKHDLSKKNKDKLNEDEKYSKPRLLWRDLYPQVLASCISLLVVIQPGINLAFSNNLLHHLPSLNKGHFSWITSILALCTPIGALLIGVIMDRIGRKKACLLTCLPLLASWIIAAISSPDSIFVFYASRILAGVGAGMTTVGIVYVSEISHSSYKQILLSLNSVFFSGGILLSTCLVHLKWNVINFTFIGLVVVNMVLIIVYMPESPIWLLKFKSFEYVGKAKTAVKQIYPKNDQIFETEWTRLKETFGRSTNCDAACTPSFIESLRSSPAAYKPMAIMAALLLLQQLSGAYPTISYALPMLKLIVTNDGTISETDSLTVLGAIRFVSGILACLMSFYVGRKPLLIVSCVGMTLSSALVAFTYDSTARPLSDYNEMGLPNVPLSLCGVMLYMFSSSLGVLVFPWTLICELLSTSVRAVGGCLLVSYSYLLMFLVLKSFPYVLATLSLPNVFSIFGLVSLLMAVYVHFVVPETLGKSFQEIEDYFTRSNRE